MRAADTETTGLYLHHGCRPFYFSGCDDQGNHYSKEWRVDPYTRLPIIPRGDITEVSDYLNEDPDGVVFQNIKFDLHALRYIGVKLPPWKKLHCTLTMMHALDSAEPRDLKGMAAKYFNYPIGDEKILKQAVIRARNKASKLGWAIAEKSHPHFRPDANKKSSKAGPECDYWLPREVAIYNQSLSRKAKLLTPEEEAAWLTVCSEYADNDARRTIMIYMMAEEALKEQKLWKAYSLNRQALAVSFSMEKRGVHIHTKTLHKEIARIGGRAEAEFKAATQIANRALGTTDFNPGSPIQLKKLLFDHWQLPVNKITNKGNASTDFDALMALTFSEDKMPKIARTFLKSLMTARKFSKAAKDEQGFDAYRIGDRIHGNINITRTATTRISITDPGLQTIAKDREQAENENEKIKEFLDELYHGELNPRVIFGPDPTKLWYGIDYSQLQLRIFGKVSGESKLVEALRNGWDAHDYVASAIFVKLGQLKPGEKPNKYQRRVAKAVNFGYIFGASPAKIDLTAGIPGLTEIVNEIFPYAHDFMKKIKRDAYRTKSVMAGFYRLACEKPHKGVNYIIQGYEGLIVKKAMIDCHRYLLENDPRSFITLQIHDELLFEVPRPKGFNINNFTVDDCPHLKQICRMMVNAGAYFDIETPVSPEVIDRSWNKGHSVTIATAEV